MADWRETNFGSLAIPLNGLRAHADLNKGDVVVPEHLKNHQEISDDLLAALAAGKREDPNWLTGYDVVAEVSDENSPWHGRSAYRIFARAAAFESILTKTNGRFVHCPNQEIIDLVAPVKNLRDYAFKESGGLLSLFPETVSARQLYADQLSKGLEVARKEGDLDTLSGTEALDEVGFGCDSTHALDLFWQSAFASAWIKPDPDKPTIPVARPGVGPAPGETISEGQGKPTPPPAARQTPPTPSQFFSNYMVSPFNNPGTAVPVMGWGVQGSQWNPLGQQPGLPGMMPSSPFGYGDETMQLVKNVTGYTTDAALAGGGLVIQRGVVEEFKMTFRPVASEGGTTLALKEVDRIPKTNGGQSEPLRVEDFQRNQRRVFSKARSEAEILYERAPAQSKPAEIVRTGVKRGWIKGAVNFRRIFGWTSMMIGAGHFIAGLFRKDGRGLDGPLTDAGMNPVGAKTAWLGVGLGLTAVAIFTGGLALPALLAFGAVSAVGLGLETHDIFEEANAKLDQKFKRLDRGSDPAENTADPSREKWDPATDRSPLLVIDPEFGHRSPRAGFYT